jgi:hypothetical protein
MFSAIAEIKEQFPEGEEEDDENTFDLEKYDEYLLRKNMDAIFDDMMGDESGNPKETVAVNTIGLENLVINPRFEGGPHIKVAIFPKVPLTSQKGQHLVNFHEVTSAVASVRSLVGKLREEFEVEFGFVSPLYQLAVSSRIVRKMHRICLEPS